MQLRLREQSPVRRFRVNLVSLLVVLVGCLANGCDSPAGLDPIASPSVSTAAEPGQPALPTVAARCCLAFKTTAVTAKSADDLVNSIGVNVHLSYFGSPYGQGYEAIVKPKLIASGIRHLRDAGTILPDDQWMRIVYGRMSELARHGLKFSLIMRPAPASTAYDQAPDIPRLLQFAGNSIEAVEGLNEHDLTRRTNWVTEVRSFQTALWRALKSDPRTDRLPIYGPSMGRPDDAGAVGDLSQFLDAGNLHPYPGGRPPLASLDDYRARDLNIRAAKPYVVTETGYHTGLAWTGDHPPVTERAMGRYVGRMAFEFFAAGVARTYLYEFIDQGTRQSNREENFGLLRADGTPKPAYTTLQNIIGVLGDPGPAFKPASLTYALTGDTTDVQQLLLAKRDGRLYLVLWQAAKSYDLATRRDLDPPTRAVSLELEVPARRVRVFAPNESSAPRSDRAGVQRVPLAVPDAPLIVEITR